MDYTDNKELDEEDINLLENNELEQDTSYKEEFNKSDDIKERILKLNDITIALVKEEKTIDTLSQSEFDEFIKLALWEDFIVNSIRIKNSNKKQKLEDWFLDTVFLSNYLQNKLIKILQDLNEKINNNDETDYVFNDNICIKSYNLRTTKDKIYHIILANNISYIRKEINEIVKNARVWTDQYNEAIDSAAVWFSEALNKFDTSWDYKIWLFSRNYILSEVKKTLNFETKIKYPIKLIKLEKILKQIKENYLEYSDFSYYNLLNEIVFNIDKIDKNIVLKVWVFYDYILSTDNKKSDNIDEILDNETENKEDDILESMKNLPSIMTLIKNPLNKEKFEKKFKKLESDLNWLSQWVDSLDRPLWDEWDSSTLWESLKDDTYDFMWFSTELHLIDNEMILDREIKKDSKLKSNLNLSLQERIIAWWFIEWYFTIKEFRDLLLEYWESIWHWDRYVKRFHFYLSIFNFKNKDLLRKSDWTLIDDEPLDALNFEQVWDIFWFTKQNAIKIYDKIKSKFDDYYTNSLKEDEQKYFVYERTETKDLWHTKTFDWLKRIDESKLEFFHLHDIKQELIEFLKEDEKKFKNK